MALTARGRIGVLVVALLAIGGAWLAAGRRDQAGTRGSARSEALSDPGPEPVGPRSARLAALDSSLRAIEDGERATPRDRWDPQYVVSVVGREPADLFGWVQDSTTWIPYHGQLRGPLGVLMDRKGSSLDRALLLAALLEAGGHSTRLAHGEMPRDSALTLVAELVEFARGHEVPAGEADDVAAVRAVSTRYGMDAAAIARSLERQDRAATHFYSELRTRVAEQSARLLKQLPTPDAAADWTARFERATAALQDHWWVQRRDGDRWVDLDLLLPSSEPPVTPLASAAETLASPDVPLSMQHRLSVRVVAEQWAAGTLSEHRILEHDLRPSELHGRPIVLQMWPGEWPAQVHSDPNSGLGLRGVALSQEEWAVALLIGADVAAEGVLRSDGTRQAPAGGGPLGGLGQGMAGAVRRPTMAGAPARSQEMTAAWIEFEFHAPGETTRIVRRAVFDLIGAAARSAGVPARLALDDRQRLTRSLALMIRTEILPVTSAMAPDYVTHLTAQAILENGPLLRSMAAGEPGHLPDPDSLLAQAAPQVSSLYSLAAARFAWSPVGERIHVARLGLLTRHRHPAIADEGFGIRGAVDVILGDVGVSLVEPDAFEVRLRQGVLDTNAEALWWTGPTVLNAGEAYTTTTDWATLSEAGQMDVGTLQLPADARTRIAQDLAAGFIVIAPTSPVASGPEHFTGWWRVDPVTGTTRGIAGNGWGQCNQEYGALIRSVVARAFKSTIFEYALCQGLAQGINAIMEQAADLQARRIWFDWVGAVDFADSKTVFKANHKACLIGAIAFGLVSTLPIILKFRQAQKLRAARAAAGAERPPRFQRPRSGRPRPVEEPPPRPPKFVAEKEAAHRQSQLELRKAMQNYSKAREAGAPPALQKLHLENIRAQSRASMETFEELLQARREAEELARNPGNVGESSPRPPGNNDVTITDLNREFATELIQVGFGGLVR